MLHCDEERTQGRNLKLAFERLQALVDEAAYEPKEYTSRLETPPPTFVKGTAKAAEAAARGAGARGRKASIRIGSSRDHTYMQKKHEYKIRKIAPWPCCAFS